MRMRSLLVVTAALTFVPAAAFAHPSFNPSEIEPATETEAVLVVPHGCAEEGGMPEEGDPASPTVELAVELADDVQVTPEEVDGWDADVADGVVTWTDAGGATADPITLPVRVTADGDAGHEFALSVYQECENGQFFRWTEGGEYPPLFLTIAGGTEGDAEAGSEDDHSDHGGESDDHSSEADDHASEDHGEDGDHAMEGEHSAFETGDPLPAGAQALAGEEADDAIAVIMVAVVAFLVFLLTAGLVTRARGRE